MHAVFWLFIRRRPARMVNPLVSPQSRARGLETARQILITTIVYLKLNPLKGCRGGQGCCVSIVCGVEAGGEGATDPFRACRTCQLGISREQA